MGARRMILKEIDKIIEANCKKCSTRAELIKTDDRNYSKTNAYCIGECVIGKDIQKFGRKLLENRKA
ncbi:zinc-finger domain-containing protein [Anaerobacillus isosaccharinicus]|uniref:Zinc-finger domain-containing protein n=1 Tax=Anaerobacillus isosaccharinicus TaxID=1532552 RepID=A0A1S2L9L8_9BACI|nr:zinc-finger domain-containing protein [Anaerobacillus isosaccharinicus]MBA5584553.1 zinc-finger domain-containing protein [Anaerobacillus isosaccharinicus]QOY37063.1 zinc-finger domain-containing protein [Anaerobacillus isosaccharinicus]